MIYLDHAATTPLDPAVFEAMLPYLKPGGLHGNPASDHVDANKNASNTKTKLRKLGIRPSAEHFKQPSQQNYLQT